MGISKRVQKIMSQRLAPIAKAWREKITKGIEKRKAWLDNARQCELFFAGAAGWMWEDKHAEKYNKNGVKPKFHFTIAKAFEFVALYGPSLFWQNPTRTVKSKDKLELGPNDMQFLGVADVMQAQQVEMQMQAERQRSDLVSRLEGLWLNYTPGEQAGGGLKGHSELATIDALVKGRGCLTVEPYRFPESERTLTGGFYLNPYDLVIDPDAETEWSASWIAIRCVHSVWEFVKKYKQYGVTEEMAKKYALKSTLNGVSENSKARDEEGVRKNLGESFDSIVYWKIYSNGGVGTRLANSNEQIAELKTLDEIVGDHAFIVIPDCEADVVFNCPNDVFDKPEQPVTSDDLKARFAWPIPYWKDGRWPVAMLDFNKVPGSCWPMAPLTPGMAELQFMNVIMSFLPNRIISSSRDFVACPEAMRDKVEELMKNGTDLSVFGIPLEIADPRAVIQFLQHPPLNRDLYEILDRVAEAFDKRVGLSELLYGNNPGATSRTAEDAAMKRQALTVRPDHMATKVEEWQTEVAKMERVCSQIFITAEDVKPVMGEIGSMLWQTLIMSRPVEDVLREAEVSIEAGSTRKPNKDRDVANIGQAMQMLTPQAFQYGMTFGNFDAYNELVREWGKANDMKVGDVMLPNPPPPAPIDPATGQPMQQGAPIPPGQPQAPPMNGVAA
jgi:hypothetical protein